MSLDDLKKKVEEEETEAVEVKPEEKETVPEVTEKETTDEPEEAAKEQVEAWLQADEQTGGVPVKTHVKMKQKLKAKLSDSNAEVEELKKQLAALQAKVQKPAEVQDITKRPKEDDFETHTPEGYQQYLDALEQYETNKRKNDIQEMFAAEQRKMSENQARKRLNDAVEAHFGRADKLIAEGKLTDDAFITSHLSLQNAIDSVRPGSGKQILDGLIALSGEGSEKVFYHMGINESSKNKLISLLATDPTGISASVFIGEKKAELLNNKLNPVSTLAPNPTEQIEGDGATISSSKFKKKYDKALKESRITDAIAAKKEARAAGVNVDVW